MWTARKIVLLNARISSCVFILQLFFPEKFYDSHAPRLVSRWTGLQHVKLAPENSAAHSLLIAFHLVVLLHLWMAARSTRRHAHASTALMEFVYSTVALASCTPLFPSQFGSSIGLIGAIPNLLFAASICWAGGIGMRDMVGLFGGDQSIKESDLIKNTKN